MGYTCDTSNNGEEGKRKEEKSAVLGKSVWPCCVVGVASEETSNQIPIFHSGLKRIL